MGFNKVYKCLMDIFPQVDARILKAVAIENSKDVDAAAETVLSEILPYSKDVDAAAETVLSEILPYLSKRTLADSPSLQNQSPRVQANEESNQSRLRKVLLGKTASSSTESLLEPYEVVKDIGFTGAATNVDSVEAPNAANTSKFHDNKNNEPADIETDELILLGNIEESAEIGKDISSVSLNALGTENPLLYVHHETKESGSSSKDRALDIEDGLARSPRASPDIADNSTSLLENTGSRGCSDDYLNAVPCTNSSLNGNLVREENAVAQIVPSSALEQLPLVLRMRAGRVSESDHSTGFEKQGGSSVQQKSQDSISEVGAIEDATFNHVVSRSNQTSRIDLLEEVIEDAKSNKKTLFQTMQSIMNLMREVELQEEAAEQAKEDCAKDGSDILVKVEELKQMLSHAKEANEMHAGEIYGEKAILATEVRELQSRLHSLSDERDKSLSILDEMRQTLEARQAAANELMKAAEQEKLEKEKSYLNALAEQEAIMSKVVRESETLQQEAEGNSKLREYLMDRGQIVDSLQGEISVICEDVRLLKEKFDKRIPLGKSISSNQTSCILASSSSSFKSLAYDISSEQGDATKHLEKISPTTPSVDVLSPKSRSSEERYKADNNEQLDEGWEFFEDAEFKIVQRRYMNNLMKQGPPFLS